MRIADLRRAQSKASENTDGDENILKTTADNGDHGDDEQHVRERQEDVRAAHDNRIPDAAIETGKAPMTRPITVEMAVAIIPTESETRAP